MRALTLLQARDGQGFGFRVEGLDGCPQYAIRIYRYIMCICTCIGILCVFVHVHVYRHGHGHGHGYGYGYGSVRVYVYLSSALHVLPSMHTAPIMPTFFFFFLFLCM